MKKINFKKPKYIIPLIMLPFFLLFFQIFHSWGGGSKQIASAKDSIPPNQINPNMPGVSSEVSDANIKDKFAAYLDMYKHDKDASALGNINNNGEALSSDFTSAYSSDDLKKLHGQKQLDSLKNSLKSGQADIDKRMAQLNGYSNQHIPRNRPGVGITEDQLLKGFTYNAGKEHSQANNEQDNYTQQMKIFRDQMSVMDSIQRTYTDKGGTENAGAGSNTGSAIGKTKKTLTNNFDPAKFDPSKDSTFRPLPVSRNRSGKSGFNTISASKPENTIKAIIDQDIKATAGSKVRIRLLNDIFVADYLIPKGSYLWGIVTGFQTQRINISINQVMYENQPLPVQLDIFDNDGYLGLYVPNSTFREFSKQIGTQGTQGLSQVHTSDNSNVTTGLISQVFQSASTSVSKLIQKEKAFLKYNYIVYLKERN